MKFISILFCLTCSLAYPGLVNSQSHPVSDQAKISLPAFSLSKAQQVFQLDTMHWLSLDKQGLRLSDQHGAILAQFKIRAKHLDLRQHQGQWLAVSADADTQETVLWHIDNQAGKIKELQRIAAPEFALETTCLYRDQQGLLQAFLLGKEGISQQWLLNPGQTASPARLVRQLALPPRLEQCLVDDQSASLLLLEASGRFWRYRADAEGPLQAELLATLGAADKHGRHLLALAAGQVLLQQPGLAQLWQVDQGGRWQSVARQVRANSASMSIALAAQTPTLRWLEPGAKSWQMRQAHSGVIRHQPASLPFAIVEPSVQSASMQQFGDSADDPAIWRHASDASLSRVLGTNKKFGLLVYDLQGRQTQALASGRLNNVDVRQNVSFGADGARFDLAMASQRDENSLVLFQIDGNGQVSEVTRFATPLDKIYGFCLYQPVQGGLQAIVNDKDGRFLQYRVTYANSRFAAELVRQFRTQTQPEACVADDKRGQLFLGEEKRGVWVLPAAAEAAPVMQLVHAVGQHLVADTEGLALYHGQHADYLVVSSQGDHSYLVLDAHAPYRLRGKFRIGMNPTLGIDGSSETDGIEISSANLGGAFNAGLLVVQDGYKRLPDGAQNFKYVPWRAISQALNLP